MTFENLPVHIPDLPRVGSLQLLKLDPNAKLSGYIGTVIWFVILFVGVNIFIFVNGGGFKWWIFGLYGLWLILFLFGFFIVEKNYEVTGYMVRQKDIIYETGYISKSTTTIPFKRIQHCEITEGPIQKMLKIASLKVYTAGGTGADLDIDGLQKDEANRIKELITGKIAVDEEE